MRGGGGCNSRQLVSADSTDAEIQRPAFDAEVHAVRQSRCRTRNWHGAVIPDVDDPLVDSLGCVLRTVLPPGDPVTRQCPGGPDCRCALSVGTAVRSETLLRFAPYPSHRILSPGHPVCRPVIDQNATHPSDNFAPDNAQVGYDHFSFGADGKRCVVTDTAPAVAGDDVPRGLP